MRQKLNEEQSSQLREIMQEMVKIRTKVAMNMFVENVHEYSNLKQKYNRLIFQ